MSENMDILIDGKTGAMNLVVLSSDPTSRCLPRGQIHNWAGAVPRNHPTRKALSIGQQVLEFTPNGLSVGPMTLHTFPGWERNMVCIELEPPHQVIAPEPSTGLDWLKSRKPGSTYTSPPCRIVFMITTEGLSWADGDVWTWDGANAKTRSLPDWRKERWVQEASPETCPETCPKWEPEKKA